MESLRLKTKLKAVLILTLPERRVRNGFSAKYCEKKKKKPKQSTKVVRADSGNAGARTPSALLPHQDSALHHPSQ